MNNYITTKELIDELERLGFEHEDLDWFGFNALAIYHDEYLRGENIVVGIDYINIVIIPDDLFVERYSEYEWFSDIHILLDLLFRYARTPIEMRG